MRFVLPANLVEVEDPRHLRLARVGERGSRGRRKLFAGIRFVERLGCWRGLGPAGPFGSSSGACRDGTRRCPTSPAAGPRSGRGGRRHARDPPPRASRDGPTNAARSTPFEELADRSYVVRANRQRLSEPRVVGGQELPVTGVGAGLATARFDDAFRATRSCIAYSRARRTSNRRGWRERGCVRRGRAGRRRRSRRRSRTEGGGRAGPSAVSLLPHAVKRLEPSGLRPDTPRGIIERRPRRAPRQSREATRATAQRPHGGRTNARALPPLLLEGQGRPRASPVEDGGPGPRDRPDDRTRGVPASTSSSRLPPCEPLSMPSRCWSWRTTSRVASARQRSEARRISTWTR